MTSNVERPLHPLQHPPSGTFLENPSTGPYSGPTLLQDTTRNHPAADDLLSRSIRGELTHQVWISINDVIPPNQFKSYRRYVRVHTAPQDYRAVEVHFVGRKSSIYSIEDLGSSPPLADAIKIAHDVSVHGTPSVIDGMYRVEFLSLQCKRTCLLDDIPNNVFNFNNGMRKEFSYPCETERDIFIAFDVINPDPISARLVRFDVMGLARAKEAQDDPPADAAKPADDVRPHVPIGTVSSARPNGLSGTIPIGSETNALDVMSDEQYLSRPR
jgi:hypothetical protein